MSGAPFGTAVDMEEITSGPKVDLMSLNKGRIEFMLSGEIIQKVKNESAQRDERSSNWLELIRAIDTRSSSHPQ